MSTPPGGGAGRVAHVFSDDFDVDEIVGVENIRTFDMAVLREACMGDIDPAFRERVAPGDWLVAGRNFGYGHPHDQPMMVMRDLGVVGVVAGSYAPLFARGETYNGFPLIVCPGIADQARIGDDITVDWEAGQVTVRGDVRLDSDPVPAAQAELIGAGGGAARLLARRKGGELA